jgi:GNAT superfamily N-acetyltransferase
MIIRRATKNDVPKLVALIGDLAAYEREPDAVEITEQLLTAALFADAPAVFANVADDGGSIAGMTIYFRNFSTWTGKIGIFLEDFYVRPEVRGHGVGRALMGALADEARAIAGMTVYFRNYSTWTGKLGIYLEDFYVCPEVRGRGVGRALMAALAEEARAHGYARIDWSVLDWNQTALDFYASIGAKPMTGWTGYRLDGDALASFGLGGSLSREALPPLM